MLSASERGRISKDWNNSCFGIDGAPQMTGGTLKPRAQRGRAIKNTPRENTRDNSPPALPPPDLHIL
eukprot:4641920-Lingulodinium_polyedra.AAC.1